MSRKHIELWLRRTKLKDANQLLLLVRLVCRGPCWISTTLCAQERKRRKCTISPYISRSRPIQDLSSRRVVGLTRTPVSWRVPIFTAATLCQCCASTSQSLVYPKSQTCLLTSKHRPNKGIEWYLRTTPLSPYSMQNERPKAIDRDLPTECRTGCRSSGTAGIR